MMYVSLCVSLYCVFSECGVDGRCFMSEGM